MLKIRLLLLAGLALGSLKASAHRIEYYTSNGCIPASGSMSIDAYVVYAPSNTYYQWQFKGSNGTWTYFSTTSNINGQNYSVSNFQGVGENNAPSLTIASPNANLDNVQLRCLMRENYYPSSSNGNSPTIWGGDNSQETKNLRIRYNSAGACSISCEDNLLTNGSGFYGGFEQVTYNTSNGAYTDGNWTAGDGATDYPTNSGQYWAVNNPYSISTSYGAFAPHSGNYQLVVKGSTSNSDDVWYKTVAVTAGQQYSFSVWVARIASSTSASPKIQLLAGGNSLIATTITGNVGEWMQVTAVYNASSTGNITFAIRNAQTTPGSDYWAMDDICLTVDPPITIGNFVWFDVDRDGLQEANEPGVQNVAVSLYADNDSNTVADGAAVLSTTTNSSGLYSFSGFPRGKYFVKFTLPSGYTGFTTQNAGAAAISSAVNSSGQTGTHDFQASYDMKDAGLLKNITISGSALNDPTALNDNTVNGTAISALGTSALHANLFRGTTFVATTPISGGTYTFSNLPGNTTYTVAISTVAATAATTTVTSTLASGWLSTGENIGTGTGSDGTANGIINVVLTTASVGSVNFGMQQPPTANTATLTPQQNPGGASFVSVPATNFGGTDPGGGEISFIKITGFPTNATTLKVNNIDYTSANIATIPNVPTNAAGQPTQAISVDPVDGNVSVVIPYRTIDNGGSLSTNTGSVTVPVTVQPDLTPLISSNPSTMNGITNFNVTIKVSEIAGTATSGLITVLVPKDPRISFSYNSALATIGSPATALNNVNWTFDGTNQFFYIFTSTTVIPAGGFSTIGFAAQFNPQNAQGVYVLSSIITSGSGGEVKTSNNSSSISLNYFTN